MRFTLTAGQKGDAPQAAALIEGLPAEVVMADTAYDADHLRQAIAAKGALAVIPVTAIVAPQFPDELVVIVRVPSKVMPCPGLRMKSTVGTDGWRSSS